MAFRKVKSAYATIIMSGGFVFFAFGALAIGASHIILDGLILPNALDQT
jgi:hypothetical protein